MWWGCNFQSCERNSILIVMTTQSTLTSTWMYILLISVCIPRITSPSAESSPLHWREGHWASLQGFHHTPLIALTLWHQSLGHSSLQVDHITWPQSPWSTSDRKKGSLLGCSCKGSVRWAWTSKIWVRTWPCITWSRPYGQGHLSTSCARNRLWILTGLSRELLNIWSWNSWENTRVKQELRSVVIRGSKRKGSDLANQTSVEETSIRRLVGLGSLGTPLWMLIGEGSWTRPWVLTWYHHQGRSRVLITPTLHANAGFIEIRATQLRSVRN